MNANTISQETPASNRPVGRRPCSQSSSSPLSSITSPVDSLLIQRCIDCGALLAPLESQCSACDGTSLEKVPSTGHGSIVSSKKVMREQDDARKTLVPQTIAIVALDDGPWVYSWIEGSAPEGSSRQARVEYVAPSAENQLPIFRRSIP